MITQKFQLEFITPCFCAGANQAIAEVRASSIRGKLRWWFRVLGGSATQEAAVFGSVRGDEGCGSSLVVRVGGASVASKWQPVEFSGISNTGYLLYFAKASANGARWTATGALPAGSTFELHFMWRRKPNAEAQSLFDLALDCFLMLGSFGLRSTRGLGSFACQERPFSEAEFNCLIAKIKARSPGFIAGLAAFAGSGSGIFDTMGAQLRGLRQGYSAGRPGHSNPTPLGSSSRPRQTSAVYLRPVRESGDRYRLVVFEAPADKVLGRASRNGAPRLRNGIPSPSQPPHHPPRRH